MVEILIALGLVLYTGVGLVAYGFVTYSFESELIALAAALGWPLLPLTLGIYKLAKRLIWRGYRLGDQREKARLRRLARRGDS